MRAVLPVIIVSKPSPPGICHDDFRDLQPVWSDTIFTRLTSSVMCHDIESVKVAVCQSKRSGLKTQKAIIFWANVSIFWQYFRP